ncbi:hypothetical protein SDC9_166155 [bioreactor metagenome]|uniref:Uncharacterized protein n=1 Tax=bioreactor metagenome TaxID=1076179 RepID=A0A645FYK7_9ZZZZ
MSCTSCPDAIARVLMKVSKYIDDGADYTTPEAQERYQSAQAAPVPKGDEAQAVPVPGALSDASEIHVCPECSGKVEHEGGCVICRSCGFSRCG